MMRSFTKYLFGLAVMAYVIMVMGIPVYLHYCGGELEEVNYVVKGEGCCEGETAENTDDCCEDEGMYLMSSPDFTLKNAEIFNDLNHTAQTAFITLPYSLPFNRPVSLPVFFEDPDPPTTSLNVISVTVLRI